MPKVKYHNLQGWMRDVRQAMRDGDQVAYELAELFLDVDDLVDGDVPSAVDAAEGDDDTEDAIHGDSGDVDSGEPAVSEADVPRARRHDARGSMHRAASSGMGRPMDDMAGDERASPQPCLKPVRVDTLGATQRGLNRSYRGTR